VGDGVGAPVTAVEAAIVAAAMSAVAATVTLTVRVAKFAAWFALAGVEMPAAVERTTVQPVEAGSALLAVVKTIVWPELALVMAPVKVDWPLHVHVV